MPVANKYRSAKEWEDLGVEVQHDSGDFPRAERETSIAFINSQNTAEVITAERSWMRRLEADGAKPENIQTYENSDGGSRFYIIPKAWIKRPYKSAPQTVTAQTLAGLAKGRENRQNTVITPQE